ncbi:hypothetical protein KQ3_05918 [Bacillus cereus B5-2]|nr:hypothetical protein KQ3_05918 [Bacillus cereus B5-2]
MGISYTPVWVHGNAMQYNQEEVDKLNISVSYKSDGFTITPPSPRRFVPDDLILFLPITTFPVISNAVTKVASMILKYDLPEETGAVISDLRLIQSDTKIYKFKNLFLPLTGPFMDEPVQDRNEWSAKSLKVIPNDGNLGACIEITISFKVAPSNSEARIIIGGGGLSLEHTKFQRD